MRPFERLLRRAFLLGSRFVAAAANLGWWRAIRLFGWQAWRRQLCSVYVPALGSRVFFRGADDYLVLPLLFERNFYLASETHPVRTAIDIGANIGIETLRLTAFFPEARVISVEADPDNFAVLAMNLAGRAKAEAKHAAAWGSPVRFSIRKTPGSNQASIVVQDENGAVPGVTIDGLIEELGVREVDVLKIDIEGAEASVFGPSIDRWIGRVRVIIWELNDQEAPGALMSLINAAERNHVAFNFALSGEKLIGVRTDTPIAVQNICGLRL